MSDRADRAAQRVNSLATRLGHLIGADDSDTGTLDPLLRLLLVNIVHLHGRWAKPFGRGAVSESATIETQNLPIYHCSLPVTMTREGATTKRLSNLRLCDMVAKIPKDYHWENGSLQPSLAEI